MTVSGIHKGLSVKVVSFSNVGSMTNSDLYATAKRAAREHEHSLFGFHVRRDGDNATVELYTD